MKALFAVVMMTILAGCSSVTVRTDSERESTHSPTFQQRYTYWWWGLKGEHSINVREVCEGKPVEQIQAVYTFVDALMGLGTLGIYAPRTAKVWCEDQA